MVLCNNVAHFMALSRTDYGAITPTFVCPRVATSQSLVLQQLTSNHTNAVIHHCSSVRELT